MILTFEADLERVKLNNRAKYLDQTSFRSKIIVHTHTRHSDKSIGTTKVVSQKETLIYFYCFKSNENDRSRVLMAAGLRRVLWSA